MRVDGLATRLQGRLDRGRAAAAARMLSRVTVRRPTGAYVAGADGYEVPEWVDVLTGSPFQLGGSSSGASKSSTRDSDGVEMEVAVRVGKFPHDTTGLKDGDYIDITAGENAGLVFRIVEAAGADQQTALRLPIEAVKRPSEWEAV